MSSSLHDLSTPSLVTAIEANLFALMAEFEKWPRAQVQLEAHLQWSLTDIAFPLFNSILRARLEAENVATTIQGLVAQAKARHVPLLWWTGPSTQPTDLGQRLEQSGFVNSGQSPGMAVALAQLAEPLPGPANFSRQ